MRTELSQGAKVASSLARHLDLSQLEPCPSYLRRKVARSVHPSLNEPALAGGAGGAVGRLRLPQ
jgi:hypothetical protein